MRSAKASQESNAISATPMLRLQRGVRRPKDKITILNVICRGTLYSMFFPTAQKSDSAADVWKVMLLGWVRVFEPRQVQLADGGREFVGEGFAPQAERAGIPLEVSNADAPWERGRTVRAGGIFNDIYCKTRELACPIIREECHVLIYEAAGAKASMSNPCSECLAARQ